jgi:hypothetical protein
VSSTTTYKEVVILFKIQCEKLTSFTLYLTCVIFPHGVICNQINNNHNLVVTISYIENVDNNWHHRS